MFRGNKYSAVLLTNYILGIKMACQKQTVAQLNFQWTRSFLQSEIKYSYDLSS